MTPEQALWCEVLYMAVTDALTGVATGAGSTDANTRVKHTEAARRYITQPSADLNQVCHMAGLEPEAVRAHAARLIAKAPAPAELAQRRKNTAPELTHDDQTHTLNQWAEITGLPLTTLRTRVANGWTVERTLTAPYADRVRAAPKPKPKQTAQTLTFSGKTRTVAQWANATGIKVHTLQMRLRSGWTVERTLTTQPIPRGTPPKVASTFTPPAQERVSL